MPTAGIKVLVVGKPIPFPDYEVKVVPDSSQILHAVARFKPDVIVSSDFVPGPLKTAPFEIRKRWIHVEPDASIQAKCEAVENCHAHNLWHPHPADRDWPLLSVYTAAYNAGDYIHETFQSLLDQTYTNWEWVVVDDGSTDGTWENIQAFADRDPRVRAFRNARRLGRIGAVKDVATRLANGLYLVELDHDDMLVDQALADVRRAFESDANVGMVYSNCAAFFEDGTPHRYNDAFWKYRYRETLYRGKTYLECRNPDIYDRFGPGYDQQFAWFLTVGPNHLRAYRTSAFRLLGGYNPRLPVADDWDLYARFFLNGTFTCAHIDRMLYLYRVRDDWKNTTFVRNKAIQAHLELGRARYREAFKAVNAARLAPASDSPRQSDDDRDPDYSDPPAVPVEEVDDVAEDIQEPDPPPAAPGGIAAPPASRLDTSQISFVVLEAVSQDPVTLACLKSIRAHAPGAEIILVENGCPVHREAAGLADKVVELEANLRFSAGMNRGLLEAKRDFVCFMNNDAAFVDDTPLRLLRAVTVDHLIVAPYSNAAKPPQGDFPRDQCPREDLHVQTVVGVCLLMPTSLARLVGGFDVRLFTWEDDDLCLRTAGLLKRSGCAKIVGGTWVSHERHHTIQAQREDVYAILAENGQRFRAMHPSIRVIAIAKDEEACIEEFFRQFAPVTRDWCLLDTGSRDCTKDLARAVGAKVASAPFEHFAAARNEALRAFADGADWVVMLDPDERLDEETIKHLRETLAHTPHDVLMAPLEALYAGGARKAFVPKPFALRPRAGTWMFQVHEKFVSEGSYALVRNALITHVVSFHEDGRRRTAEAFYKSLMEREPYFSDLDYRRTCRERWPILDYDRLDDPRIVKMATGPLVSVVIPTYRRPALLLRAVESVRRQTYANVETIVVGDACPDLEALGSQPPVRLNTPWRALNLPRNHGAGGAVPRNYGIMLASGEIIAYLDDDNAWTADHLETVYEAMRKSRATWGFSSMSVDGNPIVFKSPAQGQIDTSCVLHYRSLIRRYGWWKTRGEAGYAHDWEFFSRFVGGNEPVVATERPTVLYNADTSGQREWIRRVAQDPGASGQVRPPDLPMSKVGMHMEEIHRRLLPQQPPAGPRAPMLPPGAPPLPLVERRRPPIPPRGPGHGRPF